MGARRGLRVVALAVVAAMALLIAHGESSAAEPSGPPIRIGDLNSYTRLPAFTVPYRQGWEMGVAEINAAGGVLGRPLEVVSRDDGGKPGDAITVANELVSREGVVLLFGTLLSNVGLAVSDFAHQRKIVFLAAEPLTYATAILFESRGFSFMSGRRLMEEIHQEFQPGGRLRAALDGSTPFRQPGQAETIRGRAWAIHDGILEAIDRSWNNVRMVKRLGHDAGINTFPDAVY